MSSQPLASAVVPPTLVCQPPSYSFASSSPTVDAPKWNYKRTCIPTMVRDCVAVIPFKHYFQPFYMYLSAFALFVARCLLFPIFLFSLPLSLPPPSWRVVVLMCLSFVLMFWYIVVIEREKAVEHLATHLLMIRDAEAIRKKQGRDTDIFWYTFTVHWLNPR